MLLRIWAVMQKEFAQSLRDRRTLGIQLTLPLFQLILVDHALSIEIDRLERSGQIRRDQRLLPIDARARILYNPDLSTAMPVS